MAVDLTEFDDGDVRGVMMNFGTRWFFVVCVFFGVAKGGKEKLRFLLIDSR